MRSIPVVLTIAKIDGGTTSNVIPEAVKMLGTLRSVSETSRKRAKEGLKKVIEKIAEAHDAHAEVKLTPGYDVTVNDGRMVALAAPTSRAICSARTGSCRCPRR